MPPPVGSGDGGPLIHLARSWTHLGGRQAAGMDARTTMLMAVSLVFGLLSTFAVSFAFYWFVKMRRTFRHE